MRSVPKGMSTLGLAVGRQRHIEVVDLGRRRAGLRLREPWVLVSVDHNPRRVVWCCYDPGQGNPGLPGCQAYSPHVLAPCLSPITDRRRRFYKPQSLPPEQDLRERRL